MTALLTDNLPLLAGAPNGIQKLRELILELAVRGKLVPQDPSDEPASELLKRIAEEKARLVAEGRIKQQKSLAEIGEEERSFGLPAGWAWQRFADFALDVSTGPFGSLIHQSDYVDGGVPLVNPSHMIDGRIVADQAVSLSTEMAASLASYRLSAGDMVMARRGEVGRVALVTETEDGWLCGTGSFVLRFTPEISREYVWALFRCNSVRTYLAGAAVGTTMVNLNHGILLKMPIAVPPLAEQHRIVAKVDELMALCDRLEARQADAESAHVRLVQALLDSLTQASDADDFAASWQRLAEHFHSLFTSESSIDALKQTLLQLAVRGKLVAQDPNDEPASELLKRIAEEKARLVAEGKIKKQKPLAEIGEEEKAFELPQGWQWARKAEVFNFLNGYAFKSEWFRPEGVRLLRNVNVSHGVVSWKEDACISEEQAANFQGFLLEENDVVLTLDRPIISTGLKYAVISSCDLPCLLLQRVAKIAPYAGSVTVGYLSAWLNSRIFVDAIDPGRSNGVPHISTNQVASMPFALPPLAEQHRIVAKLDQLLALCDQLKTRLTHARQLNEQLASTLVEQAVA